VEEEQQEEQARPKPSRRTLILLVAPIIAITTMGFIATAFTPALAARHPLLLITLDARNRFLVLAREVDIVPFVIVAILRRTFSDPLFYLLGRFYGEGAVRWLEKKAGFGDLVKYAEKFFAKAAYPMVFFFPGAIVCALAGQTGMSPVGFMVTNLAGTLAAVLVVTTIVSVTLVVLSVVLNRYQGKLDADLEELEAGAAGTAGRSDVEEGVEADGDPGAGGDRLHGEQDTRHE
jgi:hypothetical protein